MPLLPIQHLVCFSDHDVLMCSASATVSTRTHQQPTARAGVRCCEMPAPAPRTMSRPTIHELRWRSAVLTFALTVVGPPAIRRVAFCDAFVPNQRSLLLQHAPPRSFAQRQCSRLHEREPRRARPVGLAARGDEVNAALYAEAWRGEGGVDAENASRAGLRKLRRKIDDGAPAGETIGTLVNEVLVGGQEILTTEASAILQRCPRLTAAAEAGELSAALLAASTGAGAGGSDFLVLHLDGEVVTELNTPWAVSVKKWRQKALAVEKYRSTNPTANAAVYTYMTNCCIRQGMWEVAYDALTYAGLMSAGPFFVSYTDVGLARPAVVLDMDRMGCYVAEKILDIDLDVWRRRGGDLTAGADTVGNNKPGVGIEEINFSQNEDSATHLAALRVQDMTLAAGRVALRKIRTELRAALDSATTADEEMSLVILSSATTRALHLGELLLPVRAIETLLSIDFAAPVLADTALAERLSEDPAIAGALGLLSQASLPIVVRGEMLKSWLAQPDDPRVEG